MPKKTIRLTIGIRHTEGKSYPPVFMEGEAPGVFATQEFIVDSDDIENNKSGFMLWQMDQEKELTEQCVELKWEQKNDDNNSSELESA